MRFGKAITLAFALTIGAPAAGQSITTDVAPGVNFSAYKSYAWINTTAPADMNPIMFQRVIAGIESALASKGYHKADPGDMSLGLMLGAQDKTDIETWGRWGLRTDVYQYTQGQLTLNAFDTRTKQALWHGQATKTINPSKPNPEKVDKAIAKLMANFPATAAAQ